jgi:replicative DNA helicase
VDDVSFEAEQAVLGALLSEPACWGDIADVARVEHFAVEAHRAVADVLFPVLAQPTPGAPPPDAVTVQVALDRAGKLGNPVPRELPFALQRAVGTTANVRSYVTAIADLWVRRQVKVAAREVLADRDTNGQQLAARLAQRVTALETARGRPARRLQDFVWERLEALEAQRVAAQEGRSPLTDRIPTGFNRLDRLVGGVGIGQATVIGARPGVGKTALESALADNFAANGSPVYVLQLEDYGRSLADRAISRRARINSMLLRNGAGWTPETWDRVRNLERYSTLPIWVDDEHGITPLDAAGKMRRAKREYGIRVFMLDVLAELDVESWFGGGSGGGDANRLDRLLGKALRLLRDTAYALDAALLVFLHLNREIEKRADPTPRLSDIKNSGDVEDAAHQIWFLSRPAEAPGVFCLDVAKHRDGPVGKVNLAWLEDYMAVVNINDGE